MVIDCERKAGGSSAGGKTDCEKTVLHLPNKQAALDPRIKTMFEEFRTELDSRNDRYERLVKLSRDVTIESKRIIFLLHQITHKTNPQDRLSLLSEAEGRLQQLRNSKWLCIAQEISADDQYMYARAYTAGMQEHIEALSFYIYIKEQRLITRQQVQQRLCFGADPESQEPACMVYLSLSDYVLGIGDLGGELMRLALNYVTKTEHEQAVNIRLFMRHLYSGYCVIGNTIRHKEMAFKIRVFRDSLLKVEYALYNLKVRRSEVPEHLLAQLGSFIAHQSHTQTLAVDTGPDVYEQF